MFEKQAFFGEVQHFLVLDMPAISSISEPATQLVLAVIRSCTIETHHPKLDIHYYSREGALDVVDTTTVQCVVGRINDRDRYAIIDRSGTLARDMYMEE